MSQATTYPTFAKTLALARERVNALFLRADFLNVPVEEVMAKPADLAAANRMALGPLPAFSKLAIIVRGALLGFDHPAVVAMAERNQMLREVEKYGFALPEVAG